ncbi:MAG: CBS domain-containing protein [Actinomycetota bacterium]|nr:CBS domain-containing protein [Actinomycetota bacterium]
MPRTIVEPLLREAPRVHTDDPVELAVKAMLSSDLAAVPVVDRGGGLAGVFGEREFMEALFPGYFGQLRSASFVRKTLDEALEKRAGCRAEQVADHMFTEHVEVGSDASDSQIAETFLHHAVLVLPVCEDGRVVGVITRRDFFRSLAERVLDTAR